MPRSTWTRRGSLLRPKIQKIDINAHDLLFVSHYCYCYADLFVPKEKIQAFELWNKNNSVSHNERTYTYLEGFYLSGTVWRMTDRIDLLWSLVQGLRAYDRMVFRILVLANMLLATKLHKDQANFGLDVRWQDRLRILYAAPLRTFYSHLGFFWLADKKGKAETKSHKMLAQCLGYHNGYTNFSWAVVLYTFC